MGWTVTADPEVFAAHAEHLLQSRPVECTLPLTTLHTIRSGQRWGPGEFVLAWFEDEGGATTGAVLMTPPFGVQLAVLPVGSEPTLVAELQTRNVAVVEAHGAVDDVERFSAAWTAGHARRATVRQRQRLYALDTLLPAPPTNGRYRLASPGDVDLVLDWMTAFRAESEALPMVAPRAMYADRVDRGLFGLWEDGAVVTALAARTVTVAGVSRIGPVYTPPAQRRRGYATAATAACAGDALAAGADRVVLFTDLANPTSNGIYQRIGFRPVSDREIVAFSATS